MPSGAMQKGSVGVEVELLLYLFIVICILY